MVISDEFYSSRRLHILLLLCQTIGMTCTVNIPTAALSNGPLGNVLCSIIILIVIGIPLLYMETVVSQFTGRDCIKVWTIRRCLSHIGYVQIIWQIIYIIYNHALISFMLYYFLISFEKPIPYYQCGPWANKDCDILVNNYTVNEDCIKRPFSVSYCDHLHLTYPEHQYWKYYILNARSGNKHFIVWRVCLSSALACAITYLSCFKRKQSLKCFLDFLTLYPICTYILLLTGSMFQKGIVVEYEGVMDLDFSIFFEKFRVSNLIQQLTFTLTIGSGITSNFASSTNFRSPCYGNVVICVAITGVFIILTDCTTAMLYCPYAYHYSWDPEFIIKAPISLLFEKVPRLIWHYTNNHIWLPLIYSSNALVGLNTNVVTFFNLLEVIMRRNPKIAKYPGLLCLGAVTFLFMITIPLQSRLGMSTITVICRTYLNLLSTFIAIIECVMFVLLYGLHRFGEDIHFMQGVQTSIYMKIGWVLSTAVLIYTFCSELRHKWGSTSLTDRVGRYFLAVVTAYIFLGIFMKLVISAFRKSFKTAIRMDPTWGPKSEILQRSRAMFTAQAMTKEYMYRQYHLQAGINERQKRANRFRNTKVEHIINLWTDNII